jgi:hypothetical protein
MTDAQGRVRKTRFHGQGLEPQSCPNISAEPVPNNTISRRTVKARIIALSARNQHKAPWPHVVRGLCALPMHPYAVHININSPWVVQGGTTHHLALPSMSHMPGRVPCTFPMVADMVPQRMALSTANIRLTNLAYTNYG